MKIVVSTAVVPFVDDEVRRLGSALEAALRAVGHSVDLIGFPVRPGDTRLARTAVATQQFRLDEADAVIALAFPATLVPHSRVTLWLTGAPGADHGSPLDPETASVIAKAETRAAANATAVFRSTDTLPPTFGGRDALLLLPPSDLEPASHAWATVIEELLP